jgi:hypothetical protein
MDQPLRNALWNWAFWAREKNNSSGWSEEYWYAAATGGVWDELLHATLDTIPLNPRNDIKRWFMALPWDEAYGFIEYLLPLVNHYRDEYGRYKPTDLRARLNGVLERELSGYRVIRDELVPVTSPTEIAEIASAAAPKKGFEVVSQHIVSSLSLLGKKPEPDYRNSVKESISAVEAAAKLLTGEKSGGIDKALAILDKQYKLHPAFKQALSKLYAYTSDDDGIRHSLLEEDTVDESEARFFLVACSAFANWLLSVGQRTEHP